MKKAILHTKLTHVLLILTVILILPHASVGDPRAQTVQRICQKQEAENETTSVSNFVATMGNISTQMQTSGFGTAVTGSGIDTSYGLAQCYGDLSLVDDCVICYAEARTLLPQCFPSSGGRIYLDGCFMRSENYSFFQEYIGPQDKALCGNKTRKSSSFQDSARKAVVQVVENGPINNGYARAEVAVSGTMNESAYVLANCWNTLNSSACKACLDNASESILKCLPWSEGRALYTGCFMRYSNTNFLNPVPRNGNSRASTMLIVIAVVSSIVVLVVGGTFGFYMWKHRLIQKKRRGSSDAEKGAKNLHDRSLNFKYSTLEKATESFDEANKLGQGGFGTVYKGVLPDGREIAVKRLFLNNRAVDFYNEVNIISSLEHKNLVRLLGCSCSGPESLLVYEFLPNLSLDKHIFNAERGKALNWEKRYEIIIATAEGLVYLHENTMTRIIHRDIKASNILLDWRMRAKIADFGLARCYQEDESHISTGIVGTLGYMAPEYLAHGQLTEKIDVYSFGVLLLEIITGRQNNRSENGEYSYCLVTMVWKHFQQGRVEELFDPNLILRDNTENEVLRVVHIGLLCTQEAPSLRPSMSMALQMLAKLEEHLPPPNNPPFMDEDTMELNDTFENPFYRQYSGNCAPVVTISESTFHPR